MKTKTKKLHEQLFEAYNNGKEAAQREYLPKIQTLEQEVKHLKVRREKEEAIIKMLQACSSMQESCARLVMSIEKYG